QRRRCAGARRLPVSADGDRALRHAHGVGNEVLQGPRSQLSVLRWAMHLLGLLFLLVSILAAALPPSSAAAATPRRSCRTNASSTFFTRQVKYFVRTNGQDGAHAGRPSVTERKEIA